MSEASYLHDILALLPAQHRGNVEGVLRTHNVGYETVNLRPPHARLQVPRTRKDSSQPLQAARSLTLDRPQGYSQVMPIIEYPNECRLGRPQIACETLEHGAA